MFMSTHTRARVLIASNLRDEKDPVFSRHLIEDHPLQPFLALQHRPWVFRAGARLDEGPFLEAMRRDPVAFLRSAVMEVATAKTMGSGRSALVPVVPRQQSIHTDRVSWQFATGLVPPQSRTTRERLLVCPRFLLP